MNKTDFFEDGLRQGFQIARESPDLTLEQFMADCKKLRKDLEARPTWQLRLLSGEGNYLDRIRYALWKRNETL